MMLSLKYILHHILHDALPEIQYKPLLKFSVAAEEHLVVIKVTWLDNEAMAAFTLSSLS